VALKNKDMKRFFICLISVSVSIHLLQSCYSHVAKASIKSQTSTPTISVVWNKDSYDSPPLKYFHGEAQCNEVIGCDIECFFDNDLYNFRVIGDNDTVSFSLSKYYIGTNVDSVNIMINMSTNGSQIHVVHDCTWGLHGKWFCRGSRPMTDLCHISSTTPVHVAVFVLVDVMKENKQSSVYEILEEKNKDRLDSIIQSLPSQ